MAKTKKVKIEAEVVMEGKGIIGSSGAEEKSPVESGEQELKIVPEPVEEVEMYNGKKIIERGEVEIHGVMKKTITTEEGSTYTL